MNVFYYIILYRFIFHKRMGSKLSSQKVEQDIFMFGLSESHKPNILVFNTVREEFQSVKMSQSEIKLYNHMGSTIAPEEFLIYLSGGTNHSYN